MVFSERYWTEDEKRERLEIRPMTRRIEGQLCRTAHATILAADPFAKLVVHKNSVDPEFDTWEWLPATFLLRGNDGVYFAQRHFPDEAEVDDELKPLSVDDAVNLFDQLPDQHYAFESAFPDLVAPPNPVQSDGSRERKLARAVRLAVTALFTEPDWIALGNHTDTVDLITGHDRLLRSLRWGDGDYATCAVAVLGQIIHQASVDEVAAVVDDLVGLQAWLRTHHPALYHELYGANLHSALAELEAASSIDNVPEIARHIARIRQGIVTDPEQAIGSAKELLETVLKTILDIHGAGNADDIPTLVKRVRKELDLESGSGGNARDRALNGLSQIAAGITELRNLYGTGHGRSRSAQPDAIYARLVVDAAATLAIFLFDLWRHHATTDKNAASTLSDTE